MGQFAFQESLESFPTKKQRNNSGQMKRVFIPLKVLIINESVMPTHTKDMKVKQFLSEGMQKITDANDKVMAAV